ncbi:hypothetical protein KKF91_18315 [Myxococcota bacterium]|nr:hypothetical protein [Myxococcota bacterium]
MTLEAHHRAPDMLSRRPLTRATSECIMRSWLLLFSLLGVARALPQAQDARDSDDDAEITLRVLRQAIADDPRSWCEVQILITGGDVRFSAGDRVSMWVYEDDISGDDLIWETRFDVTADEISRQRVERAFDCSGVFPDDDLGDYMEIYAEAEVEKDECGWGCLYDRPQTANLDVEIVEDDGAEEDDLLERGPVTGAGRLADRVARDPDWLQIQIDAPSRVIATLGHAPASGRLSLALHRGAQALHQGVDEDHAARLETPPLEPGAYGLKIQPASGDFNFYDLDLSVIIGGCVPGQIEQVECGLCGHSARTCEGGEWGPAGPCEGEGECRVGASREAACGRCGRRVERCDAACRWIAEGCFDEGECTPEAYQDVPCAGGSQAYRCTADCAWEIGPCLADDCTPGEARACYPGPLGTGGIGACQEGAQRCVNGAWGACEGAVTPDVEWCEGGEDEDCDGLIDAEDGDCDGIAEVGDACATDEACAPEMTCLTALWGGYCGGIGCEDCPVGAGCGAALGLRFCARRCGRNDDCRNGYHCAPLVGGGLGCLPLCEADEDCADPAAPVCALSGECVAEGPRWDAATPPPWDAATPRDAGEAFDEGATMDGALVEADSAVEDASPFSPPPDAYRAPPPDLSVEPGIGVGEPVACGCDLTPRAPGAALPWLLLLLMIRPRRLYRD